MAKIYGTFIFIAAPFIITNIISTCILRAIGKMKAATIGILLAAGSNIILDSCLILPLKIKGAGIALLASQIFEMLYLLLQLKKYVKKEKNTLFKNLRFNYLNTLKVGVPSLFRQGTASLAVLALNIKAGEYGDDMVSAMSIVTKIFMLFFSVAIGVSQGYQPVAGYNYGAGKIKRMKEAAIEAITLGTILLSVLAVLLYYFREPLLDMFAREDKVIQLASKPLQIMCFALPFLTLSNIANMTWQAMERPLFASILAALRQGIFFLPLIYILPSLWGQSGIYYAQPISDVLTFFASLPFLLYSFRKANPAIP